MSFGRRDILRAAGGFALASGLGFLPRFAQAQGKPRKRLIVFYTPNGHNKEAWGAVANGASWDLGSILAPLASLKNDVTVLQNVDNRAAGESPASINPHWRGIYTVLTGTRCLSAPPTPSGVDYGYFGGISIDQLVGKRMTTPLKVLNLGVQTRERVITAAGMKASVPPELDPLRAFDKIAGVIKPTGTGPDPKAEALARRRQAVLDATLAELDGYSRDATGDEKDKILAHAASVDELKASVTNTTTVSCTAPTKPAALNPKSQSSFPNLVKSQLDLAVAALTCDVTRVVTLQFSHILDSIQHTWANAPGDHHLNSHEVANTPGATSYEAASKWYATQFAYLLGKMKAVSDGGGKTLLDNSVVVWVSDLGRGRSHSLSDKDFVLGGGLGGGIRSGRLVQASGKTTNDFWLTILQGLDQPDTSFGEGMYVSGGIAALR